MKMGGHFHKENVRCLTVIVHSAVKFTYIGPKQSKDCAINTEWDGSYPSLSTSCLTNKHVRKIVYISKDNCIQEVHVQCTLNKMNQPILSHNTRIVCLIQQDLRDRSNSPLCQFTRCRLTFCIFVLVSLFLMIPLAGRDGGGFTA